MDAQFVDEAGRQTLVDDVRAAIQTGEISAEAPEGTVFLHGPTQHTIKPVRIGIIREDGLIDTVAWYKARV